MIIVYRTKCGTKNEEDSAVCVRCRASLTAAPTWRRERKRREKDECFGLPHGGAIVDLKIGIIIILVGLSWIPGLIPSEVRDVIETLFWPLIMIAFGILIIA